MKKWKPFPHDNAPFQFNGERLKQVWKTLHAGDCETFPNDPGLQQAWRCFHQGDFQQAVTLGDELGIVGHAVANKATGVYATYLEENDGLQAECFKMAIKRAEKAIEAFPEDPNSHYFHAFNLGRYSQSISVVKALKQGLGGKILKSLQRVLQLQPKHAEAHTAMGMYHAEIINKVGKLVGSLTYGASDKEAVRHFETAVKLTPSSPVAHIEYANGLYLLYGDGRLDEVTELYEKAADMDPRDAMEKLDVESARAEFE